MNKKSEFIGNAILIAIGLCLGIIAYVQGAKDLSLVGFSIALASILYQFLGGIGDENSVQLGAIKFGGAVAVIAGFMLLFKQYIFVASPEDLKITLEPKNGWIPISAANGETIDLQVYNSQDTLQFPSNADKQARSNHPLHVIDSDSSFAVKLASSPETVGAFDLSDLNTSSLYNETKIDESTEKAVQVFKLYPYREELNSSSEREEVSLPFEVTVNKSRFSIHKKGDPSSYYFKDLEIIKRTSYMVPIDNHSSYVVFLESASSTDSIPRARYSKWLAKKISHDLQLK